MSVYKDLVTCDLRRLTSPEAVRQITEISDVVLLLLPKTDSPELNAAFSDIPKTDIVNILYLDPEAPVHVINGRTVISDETLDTEQENIFIINGTAVLVGITKKVKISAYVNGKIILAENVKPNILLQTPSLNGKIISADFTSCKSFSDALTVDADMLQYLPQKCALICSDSVRFSSDITISLLQEKQPIFFVSDEIRAPRALLGYLKATSQASDGFHEL